MKVNIFCVTIAASLIGVVAFAKVGSSMKGRIEEKIQFNESEKFVSPLFSGPFKVIGIGLSKGQKLEKHQTPTAAFLYVQSGEVIFTMNEEKTNLKSGDYFSIPPKQLHEVEAKVHSRLMLIK